MKHIDVFPHGVKLLHDPLRNKGTAFTEEERDALNLRGLLPPRVGNLEIQSLRIMKALGQKRDNLERYIQLISLQDRNETLFYRVVIDNLEELMPIIYTPTVGQACQEFGHLYRRSRGMYITAHDHGRVESILRNWPHKDVRMIVVTDGERILGLGDQGADGMGIPIGKLSLYTACAGIPPDQCMPITLDMGTDNDENLADPLYIGIPERRHRGKVYDDLVDEFLTTVPKVFPKAVIQLEDFATKNAFRLLSEYRDKICLFDDDIQGTAAVTLAGIRSALRIRGGKLSDLKFLFLGAGEAGIGIGDLIVSGLMSEGVDQEVARSQCWFIDSKGLVVKSREDLAEHKKRFAHDYEFMTDLTEIVKILKPNALIGASGVGGTFQQSVVEAMSEINQRPIIFALSNPTSKSECSAEQAYRWSKGKAIFASGSPFPVVRIDDESWVPGQANNVYIFPGVGLGVIIAGARHVIDEMFAVAAEELASQVDEKDLAMGRIFPGLPRVRNVTAHIAARVADVAFEYGLATRPRPENLLEEIAANMFDATYESYV